MNDRQRRTPRRRWIARGVVMASTSVAALVVWMLPAFADELCPDAPHDCLPAWRWQQHSGNFFTDPGLNPVRAMQQGVGGALTNLLFSLARVIWLITLTLVRFATSIDWLGYDDESARTQVGAVIDDAFLQINSMVAGFLPLIILAAVITVVIATARRAGGGRGQAHWKEMLRPAVCAGLLIVMVHAASSPGQSNTWAPSWWIETSAQVTGSLWDWAAMPFSRQMATPPAWESRLAGLPSGELVDNVNTCDRAALELHRRGEAFAQSQDDASQAQYHIASLISSMWHETHLYAWRIAQFDTTRSGARVYCYVLEGLNRHNPDETLVLLNATGDGGSASPAATPPLLYPQVAPDIKRREIYMLAACERTVGGSFSIAEEWHQFRGGDAIDQMLRVCETAHFGPQNPYERFQMGVEDGAGEVMARTGRVVSFLGRALSFAGFGSSVESLGDAVQDANPDVFRISSTRDVDRHTEISVGASATDAAQAQEVRDFMYAMTGDNLPSSTMVGILAVILAFVFGLAFGGAALGATIAQIGAIVMWVAFSGILMLGMWPTQSAGQRFYRALKLLAGLMIARFVMLGLLTLLVVLTTVLQEIVSVVNPLTAAAPVLVQVPLASSSGGMVVEFYLAAAEQRSWARDNGALFFEALPPLAALLSVKYLFKQLQLGNPTSFGGAMRMVGSLTTNYNDQAGHRGGAVQRLGRRYFNPLSHYGAFSLARLPARYRRAKKRWGPEGRDRSRPPREAETGGGWDDPTAGPTGGAGRGPKGGPGSAPGLGPGGAGGRRLAGRGPRSTVKAVGAGAASGSNVDEDTGSRTLRHRLTSVVDRSLRLRDSASAAARSGTDAAARQQRTALQKFAEEHPAAGRLMRGSGRATRVMVPLAVAGGALGALPIVGAAGLAVQGPAAALATWAGLRAVRNVDMGRIVASMRRGPAVADAIAGQATAELPPPPPEELPASVVYADTYANAAGASAAVPVPPPVVVQGAPPTVAPQILPPQQIRVVLPPNPVAVGAAQSSGHTQFGEFVHVDGTWMRNTGVAAPGGVWWEAIEAPHPTLWAPEGHAPPSWEPEGPHGPEIVVPGAAVLPDLPPPPPEPPPLEEEL